MTLAELCHWAAAIRQSGGMKTSMPQRHALLTRRTEQGSLQASSRRASQAEAYPPIRKAQDVWMAIERCDRSGHLVTYLLLSIEVKEGAWFLIPQDQRRRVGWEIRNAKEALRERGIRVD